MIRSFVVALGLLTRIPVFQGAPPTPVEQGRSVLAYPLVGVVIGLLLVGVAWCLNGQVGDLRAALLLVIWVLVTGGLHLDGLADSVDAWVGGMGDAQRSLEIMKDSCSGPAAVSSIVLVLLLKFVTLKTVLLQQGPWLLLLPPILGRGGIVLLFLTTPYVRSGGMAAVAVQELPRRTGWLSIIVLITLTLFWPGLAGWFPLLFWLVCVGLLRWMMQIRLGGTTGDTAGALCELSEMAVLLALALV